MRAEMEPATDNYRRKGSQAAQAAPGADTPTIQWQISTSVEANFNDLLGATRQVADFARMSSGRQQPPPGRSFLRDFRGGWGGQ
jgi:hypothetical protein